MVPAAMAAVSYEDLPDQDVFNDFVVGPGKVDVLLQPGETRTVEVKVSNRLGRDARFKFEIEDFKGSKNPEQTVVLLGNQRGPYSLKDYLRIDERALFIPHAKRATMPVTITVPSDAEPGGRYGSVLISTVPEDAPREGPGAKGGAAIVTRIGVLFFVRVAGEVEHSGELKDFSTKGDTSLLWSGPVEFELLYENTGSVHTNAYGVVTIENMLGETVGEVPLEPWFAMPASLRLREVSWDRPVLLGRYTARAQVNRGYDDIVDTMIVTFWVIPIMLVISVLGGIALVLILFRWLASFVNIEIKRKPKQKKTK